MRRSGSRVTRAVLVVVAGLLLAWLTIVSSLLTTLARGVTGAARRVARIIS